MQFYVSSLLIPNTTLNNVFIPYTLLKFQITVFVLFTFKKPNNINLSITFETI